MQCLHAAHLSLTHSLFDIVMMGRGREGDMAAAAAGEEEGSGAAAWWEADVVFCSSLCFPDALMQVRCWLLVASVLAQILSSIIF